MAVAVIDHPLAAMAKSVATKPFRMRGFAAGCRVAVTTPSEPPTVNAVENYADIANLHVLQCQA